MVTSKSRIYVLQKRISKTEDYSQKKFIQAWSAQKADYSGVDQDDEQYVRVLDGGSDATAKGKMNIDYEDIMIDINELRYMNGL